MHAVYVLQFMLGWLNWLSLHAIFITELCDILVFLRRELEHMKYLYVVTSSSLPLNCWCMEFVSYFVGCYFVVAQMPSGGVRFNVKP